jgi:hypothetical protein
MVVHSTRGTATDAGNNNARFRLSFLGFTERFDLRKSAKRKAQSAKRKAILPPGAAPSRRASRQRMERAGALIAPIGRYTPSRLRPPRCARSPFSFPCARSQTRKSDFRKIQVQTADEFLASLVHRASPISPSRPSDLSGISGPSRLDDRLYLQSLCVCTWCVAHPTPRYTGQIILDRKARKSGEGLHAPKGRQAPKVRREPTGRQDTKSRKEQPARKDHRAASADEYTVSSFLDAQYMFFENVDRISAMLPAGAIGSSAPTGYSSLTYALHVKIEWEGADSEGKPYEPTWEVADPTTVEGEAWRAFVSQKRRISGNKNWSIADIPFEHNARPGKRITR